MSVSQEMQDQLSPRDVLERLQIGNERFVLRKQQVVDYQDVLTNNAKGQYPLAFILCCVDSRATPEVIFDQTLGDIFVGRVAGNVVDNNILGSMEFATKLAGAKLIMVLGHSACGAVAGACAGVELGHLTQLVNQIQPAVDTIQSAVDRPLDSKDIDTINAIAKQNVLDQMTMIRSRSEVISQLLDDEHILMVGAMHDIASGRVNLV